MRRRWLKPSGVLGAVALSLGLSAPAWAMWEGLDPIQPIMPRWTWQGIENQERLRDLTPEQEARIRRLPADQQEQALDEMIREQRGTLRGESGTPHRMRQQSTEETDEHTRGEEQEKSEGGADQMRRPGESDRQTDDGTMRQDETPAPDADTRQQSEPSPDSGIRQQPETSPDTDGRQQMDESRQEERQMRREQHETSSGVRAPASAKQSADTNQQRVEVELKPVPKSERAPAPGETTVTADNPIDEAGIHLEMARTSAMSEDWEATKSHIRQAGDALDQIVVRGDRNAQRYLDRLKGDIRSTEKAVDSRSRDLDTRLQNLERNVKHLKPEER
jgi:hypothetical protein